MDLGVQAGRAPDAGPVSPQVLQQLRTNLFHHFLQLQHFQRLPWASQESERLGKPSEITKPKFCPNTPIPTKPYPKVPHPLVPEHFQGWCLQCCPEELFQCLTTLPVKQFLLTSDPSPRTPWNWPPRNPNVAECCATATQAPQQPRDCNTRVLRSEDSPRTHSWLSCSPCSFPGSVGQPAGPALPFSPPG